MKIVACISGWEDTDLLGDCVASASALGMPVVYADGAYQTYMRPGDQPGTRDFSAVEKVLLREGGKDTVIISAPPMPWASEAAKKTAIVRRALTFHADADWLLFLDTDERLEQRAPDGRGWLQSRLYSSAALWATLDIYKPAHETTETHHGVEVPATNPATAPFPLPRLLRASNDLEFRAPRDFDVYRGGERIAFLDGEPVPEHLAESFVRVPADVLRIRHDRHLRPVDRTNQTGEYCVRRRREHGV